MEKRALLAIAIAFAILILWPFLFPPSKEVPPAQPPEESQEAGVEPLQETAAEEGAAKEEAAVSRDAEQMIHEPEAIHPVQDTEEKNITVETSLYIITFSNRGGLVKSWKLKNYFDDEGKPLELVAPESKIAERYPLDIKTGDEQRDMQIHSSLFVVESQQGKLKDQEGQELDGWTVTFRYADAAGLLVEKTLEIFDQQYVSNFYFSVIDRGEKVRSYIIWGTNFGTAGASTNRFYYAGHCIAQISGKLMRVQKKSVKEVQSIPGAVQWAGIEDQYFAAIFMPHSPIETIDIIPSIMKNEEGKDVTHISIAVPRAQEGYSLFVGPKDYQLLTAQGNNLNHIVNFGSISLIALIAKGLYKSLIWLYDHTLPNYGFGIILITLIIRIIFFPLTQKSFVSMKKMQTQMKRIQPKINSIKERYKKKKKDSQSRQKMNQEIMALYKSEGINPMGGMTGCLPLLLQLPILWAFYNVLSAAIELRQAPFLLWIRDLSVKDPYYITPLLMGATMFVQQKMSGPVGGDPMQQRMMMFMPIIFTFLFFNFPSGLVLYWLINNILAIGQQYLINKQAEKLLGEEKK